MIYQLKALLILLLLPAMLVACTGQKAESLPRYSMAQWHQRGQKMTGIINRLMGDSDIGRVNKMAAEVQLSRIVDCRDVVDECALYNKILGEIIEHTKDGIFSASERELVKSKFKHLKLKLRDGEKVLEEQWKKFNEKKK